jgi:hypothetical protein
MGTMSEASKRRMKWVRACTKQGIYPVLGKSAHIYDA